jgi:hypothetical protein
MTDGYAAGSPGLGTLTDDAAIVKPTGAPVV